MYLFILFKTVILLYMPRKIESFNDNVIIAIMIDKCLNYFIIFFQASFLTSSLVYSQFSFYYLLNIT